MTKAQAADWYLGTVCPANAVRETLTRQLSGVDAEAVNTAKVRAAARASVGAMRKQAERLDSPQLPWPQEVRSSVVTLTAQTLADLQDYQDIASATNRDDVIAAWNAQPSRSNVPAQTIRLKLGLPTAGAARDGCAKWLAAHR